MDNLYCRSVQRGANCPVIISFAPPKQYRNLLYHLPPSPSPETRLKLLDVAEGRLLSASFVRCWGVPPTHEVVPWTSQEIPPHATAAKAMGGRSKLVRPSHNNDGRGGGGRERGWGKTECSEQRRSKVKSIVCVMGNNRKLSTPRKTTKCPCSYLWVNV